PGRDCCRPWPAWFARSCFPRRLRRPPSADRCVVPPRPPPKPARAIVCHCLSACLISGAPSASASPDLPEEKSAVQSPNQWPHRKESTGRSYVHLAQVQSPRYFLVMLLVLAAQFADSSLH